MNGAGCHVPLAALGAALAGVLLAAPSGRAADFSRTCGYEAGGLCRMTDPESRLEGDARSFLVLSVGRWQRISHSVTWMTRLEYADLVHGGLPSAAIPEEHEWNDVGRSVTLETGLQLHPPVAVGLAPYLGASVGAGLADLGSHYRADMYSGNWIITEHSSRGGFLPAVVIGAEAGCRVFAKRGWPTLCATAGPRLVANPRGFDWTFEPAVSLGY